MPNKMLGIRLPENFMNKLENIAAQQNDSVNQLAKKALIEWIEILFSSRKLKMAILPKETLAKMVSYLNKSQIEEIGKEIGTNLSEYFQFLFKTHLNHLTEGEIYGIISRYLGASGLMWFDQLEFEIDEDNPNIFLFQGTHGLALNWGTFMKDVLEEFFYLFSSGRIIPESLIITENTLLFRILKQEVKS